MKILIHVFLKQWEGTKKVPNQTKYLLMITSYHFHYLWHVCGSTGHVKGSCNPITYSNRNHWQRIWRTRQKRSYTFSNAVCGSGLLSKVILLKKVFSAHKQGVWNQMIFKVSLLTWAILWKYSLAFSKGTIQVVDCCCGSIVYHPQDKCHRRSCFQ